MKRITIIIFILIPIYSISQDTLIEKKKIYFNNGNIYQKGWFLRDELLSNKPYKIWLENGQKQGLYKVHFFTKNKIIKEWNNKELIQKRIYNKKTDSLIFNYYIDKYENGKIKKRIKNRKGTYSSKEYYENGNLKMKSKVLLNNRFRKCKSYFLNEEGTKIEKTKYVWSKSSKKYIRFGSFSFDNVGKLCESSHLDKGEIVKKKIKSCE